MNHHILAVALDFDGTLTDGSFYWTTNGDESKRLHFRDVMAISRASRLGIPFAIISGEDSPLVSRYAEKLSVSFVARGCKDKEAALRDFAVQSGVSLSRIAYMGDDINDLPALRVAGLPAAPPDAHPAVLAVAMFVADHPAGQGAVRSLIDYLWGEQINI